MFAKRLLFVLAALIAIIGVGVAAKVVGSFSVSGGLTTDNFSIPTFLDFDDPGAGGDFTFTAELGGDFASIFTAGDPGNIVDLGASPVASTDPFITAAQPGTTLQVSMTDFTYSSDGSFIVGTGDVNIQMTGFDPTPGKIQLAAFGFPAGFGFKDNEGPWFATVVAVPEPSTGVTLLAASCLLGLRRRRRT